jgi:hypothetical protein
MEWIGGTDEAKKLIAELQKDGSLLNFYSKEVLEMPKIQDIFGDISIEDLEKEHGGKFLNHLLVGCFHDNYEKLITLVRLVEIDEDEHPIVFWQNVPSFVFINLKTQSILIFGFFKRKAKVVEDIVYSTKNTSQEKFEKLDHLGIIKNIRESFRDVARGIYPTLDGFSEGELDELYKGKNGNFFSDEDEANSVDENDEDEGITKEEVDERYEELNYAAEIREDGEYRLQYYFPKFSIDNLWE